MKFGKHTGLKRYAQTVIRRIREIFSYESSNTTGKKPDHSNSKTHPRRLVILESEDISANRRAFYIVSDFPLDSSQKSMKHAVYIIHGRKGIRFTEYQPEEYSSDKAVIFGIQRHLSERRKISRPLQRYDVIYSTLGRNWLEIDRKLRSQLNQ